jgi:2'-5' RNA ligase
MRTYLVAFPAFAAADRERIAAIRERHDRLAAKLSPHVTLVFATDVLDPGGLARHAASIDRPAPFTCVFRRTRVEHDPFSGEFCVFLVPDEGARVIRELHDALYTGPLAGELRTDLPYHPHVTIARCATEAAARAVASSLGAVEIVTRIEHLHVLAAADTTFVTADAIAL